MRKYHIERLRLIADILRNKEFPDPIIGFNMAASLKTFEKDMVDKPRINGKKAKKRDCGTVACIMGIVHVLKNKNGDDHLCDVNKSGKWIGLNEADSRALFYPDDIEVWDRIKPKQAAKVIDHLIETGEVDWSIIEHKE